MTKYYFNDEIKKDLDSPLTVVGPIVNVKAVFARALDTYISNRIDGIRYEDDEIKSFQHSVEFYTRITAEAKARVAEINEMSEEEIKKQAHKEYVEEKEYLEGQIAYNKKYDKCFEKLVEYTGSIEESSADAIALKKSLMETFNHAYKDIVRLSTTEAKENLEKLTELTPAEWKARELGKAEEDLHNAPRSLKANQKIVNDLIARKSNLANLQELQRRFG